LKTVQQKANPERRVHVERGGAVWSRGVLAGVIGATVLAAWFLVVDLAQGEAFRTPAMIAGALLGVERVDTGIGMVFLFTAMHYTAFMLVGVAATWALTRLDVAPNFLFGLVLGFLLFDGVFFGSAAITGIDVVAELGWVEVLTGNMVAGMAMIGFLHLTGTVRHVAWWEALRDNRVLREGLIAGIAGGFVVATWFLIVDAVQGRPFFTPSALGSVLFLGATDLAQVEVSLWLTAAYTPIHYLVFVAVGIAAAALARQAERQPPLLIGVLLLFVAFEAFFLGIIAVVAEFLLGPLAWWSIAIGNLFAVLVIAGYLWRVHPKLRELMDGDAIERPA